MSVSEFPIPSEDEAGHETRRDSLGKDKWSPRLTLLVVVLSSLILWSGIFLVISWIF
jgi:hypothetical protein